MPDLNLGRPGLSVLPLGVGDAFSTLHYPACMLVSRYQNPAWDDELILIDCPQAIRKMMREADDGRFHGLDLHRVDTLILTHLHADHASGLETVAAFFKIVLGRKLRLIALPWVLDGVPPFLRAIQNLGRMDDFFDVMPIYPQEDSRVQLGTTEEGATFIEARRARHPTSTAALRIQHRDRLLAYSSDTAFDQGLWDWLCRGWDASKGAQADLIVHEVGHGIHADYDELAKHIRGLHHNMARDRTEHTRLIHYPDDMLPMLEASAFRLMREGHLEVVW